MKIFFEYREKMKQLLWDELDVNAQRQYCDKNKYSDMEYKNIIANYYEDIRKIMNQYLELSKVDYSCVENAYSQIDFLIANRWIRKKFIYERIHDRQRRILWSIKNEAFHFEHFFSKEHGNMPVMLEKINFLQDMIFSKEYGDIGYTIYNNYKYITDMELHE